MTVWRFSFLSSSRYVVLGCSLLFVHDGAASTAIWLIKSVIELCDMNNLLLFSLPPSLVCRPFSPCSFRFVPLRRTLDLTRFFFCCRCYSREKYIFLRHGMKCDVCVAYNRRSKKESLLPNIPFTRNSFLPSCVPKT